MYSRKLKFRFITKIDSLEKTNPKRVHVKAASFSDFITENLFTEVTKIISKTYSKKKKNCLENIAIESEKRMLCNTSKRQINQK